MERYLSNPNVDKTIVNVIQVYEGGTGGTTVKEAQENLDILDKSTIGAPNGLAILPPSGLFGGSIEGGVDDKPMIDGPSFVRTNQTNRFFITNYDIKTGYDISTSMGSIERDNDYLIFKSGPEVGVAKIKVNNLEVELPIYLAIIGMPFIVSPQSGRSDINSKVEIKTSEFVTGEVDTYHAATDWQLSTTVEMDNIFKSVEKDSSQLTSWDLEGLQENVTYYIRFRYWDNVGNKSSWSEITQFKTRVSFAPAAPTVIDPPNGAKEQKADVTFTTTPFSTYEDVTHVSSDWQVSTSSVFAGLIEESEANEVNLESWTIGGLKTSTLYYVRVRHTDSRGRKSDWSLPSRFTTRKSFAADTPKIISPVEAEENHNSSLTIVASHFSNGDSRVTHQSSDWEISEDNSFQYPFLSSYSNSTSKVEWLANKLKPATTYYVRVRYRDTLSFVTDWSKPVSFKTKDSFAPDRPIITSPMNNTEDVGPWLDMRTSAFVSNNQGDEHLNSDWEIGTSLVFKDLVKWNTATIDDKIGWRVKGLEEASQYFVRVRHRAIKDGEEVVGDWSPVVKFNTKPSFAPGRPTITYPKSGSKDINENVTFTSTNYEPSDSQDVHVNSDWEISTNSAFTDIVQSNYGSATAKTAWVVTNLKSLTTFFVRVRHRTINDGIYYLSEWSSANNFTVEHEVPAKPVILTPSNGSTRVSTTTTITCSAYVAGEVEEKHFSSSWEISTNAGFNPVVFSSINSVTNKTIWNPGNLQANTTYFARVKHIGSLGFESEWSDASQFTTKTAATSNAPTITSPSYGATNVNTTVTFTSSAFSSTEVSDNHTSSDWELATDSSFSNKVKTSTASNTDRTSWSVSGLTTNTVYYVRVRHNGSESGPSPWSSVVNFTTRSPETIGQVAKPSISSPSNGASNLAVSFTISASAFSSTASGDSHKASDWEVSKDITFSNVVKSSYDNTSSKTSWAVGGLDAGTRYYLRVRYKGTTGGNSPWSDVVNVTTTGGSGGSDTPPEYIPYEKNSAFNDLNFVFSRDHALTSDGKYLFGMGVIDSFFGNTGHSEAKYGIVRYEVTDTGLKNLTAFRPPQTKYGIGNNYNMFAASADGTKVLAAYTNGYGGIIYGYFNTHVHDFTTMSRLEFSTPPGISEEVCATPDFKTFVRTGLGKVYLVKEVQTETSIKLNVVSEATPPLELESPMGGPLIISSDGKIVFATSTSSTKVVYVFGINGNTITYLSTIQLNGHSFEHPTVTTGGRRTSWFTDSTGSILVMSATTNSGTANDDKACYIYEREGSNWVFKTKLDPGGNGDFASIGLSDNGKLITISTVIDEKNDGKVLRHNVYFYYKQNGVWVNYKKFSPTFPDTATTKPSLYSNDTGYLDAQYPIHALARDMSRVLVNGTTWRHDYEDTWQGKNYYVLNRSAVSTTPTKPATPSITSPSSGASIAKDVTILSSAFSSSSGSHASSDWEIATDSSFTNVVKSSYASTTELTKLDVINLASGKTYYVRVRYTSSEGGSSDWSPFVSFSTTQVPIPGANGSALLKFPPTNEKPNGIYIFGRQLNSLSFGSTYIIPDGYTGQWFSYISLATIDSSYNVTETYKEGGSSSFSGYSSTGPFSYHVSDDGGSYYVIYKRQTRLSGGGTDNVVYSKGISWVDDYMSSGGFWSGTNGGIVGDLDDFMRRISFDKNMRSFIFPRNSDICIISQKVNEESGSSTTVVTPLVVPSEYTPEQMGQKIVSLSPDGSVAVTVSPFNWVYIFTKANNTWTFADRFKLPIPVGKCQTSENGDVIVFAGEKTYKTVVYTRKNGVWGTNIQTILPNGRVDDVEEYRKQGMATISYDGRMLTLSDGYIDSSNVYIYRLQENGTYGEVGVINCTPPAGAKFGSATTPISAVKHQLSADGSKCVYVMPTYTLTGNNGVIATFGGEVKVAK